ncbi:MAG: TonB-dependent receptor [Pseudomonadota bacterium]
MTATAQTVEPSQHPGALTEIGKLIHGLQAGSQKKAQFFSFKPQPLAQALTKFSNQTGIQVAYSSPELDGRSTKGFSGEFEPQEALKLLLDGSKVSHRFTYEDSVVVQVAQTAPGRANDGEIALDTIVVEGELLDRNIQKTQTSVTVVTGEELESRSDTDLRDVIDRTAGVSSSARGIGIVVRGIDERGVAGNAGGGAGSTVTTSVDGARISNFNRRSTTFIPTWDLEQVEILRGPQSTQTGRNALAGAVIIRSKDPTYDQEFKIRGGVGKGKTFQGAVAFNQPIIDDILAVRIAAEFNRTDGFVINPTLGRDDEAEVRNKNIRAAIRFDPTENFSAILKFSYLDALDGFASSDPTFFPRRVTLTNEKTEDRGTYKNTNLRMSFNVNEYVSLTSETTYIDRKFRFNGDAGGAGNEGFLSDNNPGRSVEQEVKVIYKDDRLNAVLGGFLSDIRDEANAMAVAPSSALSPFLPPFTITASVPAQTDVLNLAVFGEAELTVLEKIRLIVGGRYDYEKEKFFRNSTFRATNPAFQPLLPADTSELTSTSFDAFLPKAGIVFDFTDEASLGFTYQRGYRAGGAGFNIFQNRQFEFKQEFTDNFELALRSQWFDKRLTLNANAYYIYWKDQQVQIFGASGDPRDITTENAGRSELYGGEIEMRASPTPRLDLYGSFAFVQTRFKDFVSAGVQLAGNEFRNAPRFTAAFGGTFRFDYGFYVAADGNYKSASFSDAQNTAAFRSDDRFLVDVRAGVKTENFDVFAYVKNLFNETYAAERALNSVTIGDPFTFGVVGQFNL